MSSRSGPPPLRQGIISVLQTPFDSQGAVDHSSLENLVEDAIAGGVNGFLVPAVASEVSCLTTQERANIVRRVTGIAAGRVPIIVGASDSRPRVCIEQAQLAREVGAAAYMVAVPTELYREPERVEPFFREVAEGAGDFPLMLQDLDFTGAGLEPETILRLTQVLPSLVSLKIESNPAGPKYTAIREICGGEMFLAGGWAIAQMIEALDRGVDAMIPECSMVRVWSAIDHRYRGGRREEAVRIFNQVQPVVGFTHQDLSVAIAFGKRLLVRKGIFATERTRLGDFRWDRYNRRVADELIDYYLELEASVSSA